MTFKATHIVSGRVIPIESSAVDLAALLVELDAVTNFYATDDDKLIGIAFLKDCVIAEESGI